MDKFQGTEQEQRERQAALEAGITATSDLLDGLTAALEAEAVLERFLDLGELDALAAELGVTA